MLKKKYCTEHQTLLDDTVRSVLIEKRIVDAKSNKRIIEFMEKHGFDNRKEINDQNDMVFSR